MRILLALSIGFLCAMSGAQAQNYPWCSNFADGAGANCGFATLEQCKAEILGSGGYCDRNTQYRAPAPAPARHEPRKDHAGKKLPATRPGEPS